MKFVESNKVEKFFSVQDSLNDEYILEEKPLEIPSGYRYVKADEANDLVEFFKKEAESITDEDLEETNTSHRISFDFEDKDARLDCAMGMKNWAGLEPSDSIYFSKGFDYVALNVASRSFSLGVFDIEYIFVNECQKTLKILDINDNLYTIEFYRKPFNIPVNSPIETY